MNKDLSSDASPSDLSAAQRDASQAPEVLRKLSEQQQQRLSEVLDEYLRQLEAGKQLDCSELIAANPDLSEALREYLSKLDELNWFVGGTAQPQDVVGKQLGDFRLIREIGRGGMGIVYLAQQLSLDRQVAVKLLPFASLLEQKYIERFKNEARAAAHLEHPNIVPVYAIGHDDGIHYYAMRYIEGQSLDQVIADARKAQSSSDKDTRLSHEHLAAVLEQFAEVAEALHRAHEYGVVHRDIKPSNLLSDRQQKKLWLADFGLARFQSDRPLTRTGEMIGTLRYMSPEQAAGRAELIDLRSDIYSLGATLYEMLTLQPAVTGAEGPALMRAIEQDSPVRLRKLCPSIPTDVQTLVEKAMAKHRDDRYASAELFAQDLRRASRGYPILANPISPLSLAIRWSEKHRRALGAAISVFALATLGLTISLVTISRQKRLTEQNFENARSNYLDARQAVDDLAEFSDDLRAVPGAESVHRQLLTKIRNYYEAFLERAINDPMLQVDLARTYRNIGVLAEELDSAEAAIAHYRNAERIYERMASESPLPPDVRRQQAENFNALGLALTKTGDQVEADSAFKNAMQIHSELIDEADLEAELNVDFAITLNNLGLLERTTNASQASATISEAICILEQAVASRPDDLRAMRALGAAYNNLGSVQVQTDAPQAVASFLRALDVQLPLTQKSSHPLKASLDLIATYNNLGLAYNSSQDWRAAQDAHQKAILLSRELVAIAPRIELYRRDLAVSLNNLGLALRAQGKLYDAQAAFEEAISLQKPLLERKPTDAELASNVGSAMSNLAMILRAQSLMDDAKTTFIEASEKHRIALSANLSHAVYRENLGKTLANLASLLRQLKDWESEIAVAQERRILWKDDPNQLLAIAEELALIDPKTNLLISELVTTLEAAHTAGLTIDERLWSRAALKNLPPEVKQRIQALTNAADVGIQSVDRGNQ